MASIGGDTKHDDPPFDAPYGEEEFHELVAEMVTYQTPRLFAVIQEYGERLDAWIAGWGLAFEDHVEVISEHTRIHLQSLARVVRMFSRSSNISAHLVWVTPDGVSLAESGETGTSLEGVPGHVSTPTGESR